MFNILIIVALSAVLAGKVCASVTDIIQLYNYLILKDIVFGLATIVQRFCNVWFVGSPVHWVFMGR